MIRKVLDSFPVRVVQAFGASQAANYASGLAFNGLLAMFPLMLGILCQASPLLTGAGLSRTMSQRRSSSSRTTSNRDPSAA